MRIAFAASSIVAFALAASVSAKTMYIPVAGVTPGAQGTFFRTGELLVLDNVVARLAPHMTHAIGTIRIDSETDASDEFIASSRTYTDSRDVSRPGTHGQFVKAASGAVFTWASVIDNHSGDAIFVKRRRA